MPHRGPEAPSRLLRWVGAVLAAMLLAGIAVGPGRAADPPITGGGVRASGLPWASGAFSHDAKRTVEFAKRRGRDVDVLAVFPTRDSWATLLEDWWMSPSAVPDGFHGTLNVGVPMFPDNGSLEAAARGDDVGHWTEMGRLIASRYPDAWVRPGWEMNIPNWPWSANPGNVEQYKAAFRNAAKGLRAGGPNLRIVFNPNEGRGGSLPDATLAYPGDEYVDDIGLDAYDWDPPYRGGGWQEHRTHPGGWDAWVAFARTHRKTFSVPEWGVIPGGQNSGGDDPEYISAVLGFMGENADVMSFDTYFEETAEYCRCALSLNPEADRAYTAMMPKLAAIDPARAAAASPATRRGAPTTGTDPGLAPGRGGPSEGPSPGGPPGGAPGRDEGTGSNPDRGGNEGTEASREAGAHQPGETPGAGGMPGTPRAPAPVSPPRSAAPTGPPTAQPAAPPAAATGGEPPGAPEPAPSTEPAEPAEPAEPRIVVLVVPKARE